MGEDFRQGADSRGGAPAPRGGVRGRTGAWKNILFDLDGTLTDSKPGITASVAYALARFGIREDPERLTRFIGPPLWDSFQAFYGFSPAQSAEAVRLFREYYDERGWAENAPYAGIGEVLSRLKQSGRRLIVATSKPELFAVRILDHFGLSRYFDLICGAPMDDPAACAKARVIQSALARGGIGGPGDTVMVGDRRHDVEGAHAAGLPAVGVLYGYGGREELVTCGADYLAEDPESLYALL